MRVEGNLIAIREMISDDCIQVLEWENNPVYWVYGENDSPYQLDDMHQLIADLSDRNKAKQARFVMIELSSQQRVGIIDLYEINFELKQAFVGILVDEKYRNQGMATEALNLIEKVAFEWSIHRLFAWIQMDNGKSMDLFQKLNYLKKSDEQTLQATNATYLNRYLFEKWLKN